MQTEIDQSLLLAYLDAEEDSARQYQQDELQPAREKNLNYLLSRPMGNEEDGRSQVVSSDVWDAINGMLPALLKPFTATDEYVKFEPQSAEDVAGAEQETDYVNYVIAQRNSGFMLFYQWFWDALINKYGIVEYLWEEEKSESVERYVGQTDDELAMMLSQPGVTIEQIDSYQDERQPPDPLMAPTMLHDVVLRTSEVNGRARIYNVPPEELIFNADLSTQSLKDARFVQRETYKTISEIRELGYDIPDDIMDDGTEWDSDSERANRYDGYRELGESTRDGADRMVLLKTAYCRHDANQDGVAELIRVVRIGDTILEYEEAEEIPYASIHAHVIPHKFAGVATADVVTPIQDLKTSLWRQALDNLYSTNSNRVFVSNKVNLDDLLTNPLGGIVRVDDVSAGGHVVPAGAQPIGGAIMPMIEYADTVKENRTGFTRYNSGLDANSLNKTATGVTKIMDAAQQRIELMARTFAETGVKELMIGVHGLARRNASKPDIVMLRNEWVPVDPRNWKTRKNIVVSVGIGTGDRQQTITNMQTIGAIQQQIAPLGMADKKQMYNSIRRGVEAMGYKDVSQFVTEPKDGALPPPKPDPDAMKAQTAHIEKLLDLALEGAKLGVPGMAEMYSMGMQQAAQRAMQA